MRRRRRRRRRRFGRRHPSSPPFSRTIPERAICRTSCPCSRRRGPISLVPRRIGGMCFPSGREGPYQGKRGRDGTTPAAAVAPASPPAHRPRRGGGSAFLRSRVSGTEEARPTKEMGLKKPLRSSMSIWLHHSETLETHCKPREYHEPPPFLRGACLLDNHGVCVCLPVAGVGCKPRPKGTATPTKTVTHSAQAHRLGGCEARCSPRARVCKVRGGAGAASRLGPGNPGF